MYCGAQKSDFASVGLLERGCLSCFVFQVYWAGPLSASVVAALLYNYLLAPREEPFSEQTQVLCCCDSTMENEIREPLLEDAKDWSEAHR